MMKSLDELDDGLYLHHSVVLLDTRSSRYCETRTQIFVKVNPTFIS